MATQTVTPSQARQRLFLLIIIGLFLLPPIAAWLLIGQWRPAATAHHGALLQPAQPIAHLGFRQINGGEFDASYLRGRWTMVYIGTPLDGCGKLCRDGLYAMRQVRLALGKDMLRAQTLFLMTTVPDDSLVKWLGQEHAALTAGVADAETLEFFGRVFADPILLGEWIYLVDPLGNLFMRYGVETDPKGMLEDLTRLLKYSRIG
jgi:hypothetical protein